MAKLKALILENNKTSEAILADCFADSELEAEFVQDIETARQKIQANDSLYALIVASKMVLREQTEYFAHSLRTGKYHVHTPLILLVTEYGDVDRSYYAIGYTQIFARSELTKFKNYIKHFVSRGAYNKNGSTKIVIIEDDLPQQLVVKSILEKNFCECVCFNSAEDVLRNVPEVDPDVVVADFFLEGRLTGMDFLHEVRQLNHPWRLVPVLAITAIDDPARKYEFLRAGANDYLVKPVDSLDLVVRVENLVRYKRLLETVEDQREEMYFLAMHDQLTGLYNRHFMVSQANARIKEAFRHNIPYAIILLDIDNFKKINDTCGHDVGDEVLRKVGQLLTSLCREEDFIARLGGEEFIIFLSHCAIDNALKKAEELRQAFEREKLAGQSLTASFGVTQLSHSCNSLDALYKVADEALYRAKHSGRNRVIRG